MIMTYYISPTGNDSTGNGTPGAPWRTLTKAFSVGNGGDTYILKDGTYDYVGSELGSAIKSGTSVAWTKIKAENDGKAVISITNGVSFPSATGKLLSYVQVEGLKVTGQYQKVVNGSKIKVLRTSFSGGPLVGNAVSLCVGGNDFTPVSNQILFEDCWVYGAGGRYNVLIFNAEQIIFRRTVARHEGGWTDTKGDPEAVFALYNSSQCRIQNTILLDNTGFPYHTFSGYGAFYLIRNQSANPDHVSHSNIIRGLIVLNTDNMGFLSDAANTTQTPYNQLLDYAIINPKHFGMSWGSNANSNMTTARGLVIRKGMTSAPVSGSGGLGYWGTGGSIQASNLIVSGFTTAQDIQNVKVTNFDTFNNGSYASGTGKKTYDPSTNGLLYPTRTEAESQLAKDGIGPNITSKIGASNTLYGEVGFDDDTQEPLWPWPNEARIKADMSVGQTKGWGASTKTLTAYVWESLGNKIPDTVYTPVPPPPPPAPPTATITVDKTTVTQGQLVMLAWLTVNAQTASINTLTVPVAGSTEVAPTVTTTYTITATGLGGTVQASVTVVVTIPPPPPPPEPTVFDYIDTIRTNLDALEQKLGPRT